MPYVSSLRPLLALPLLAGMLLLAACDSGGSSTDPIDDPGESDTDISAEAVVSDIEDSKWALVYAEPTAPGSDLDTVDFDCPAVTGSKENASREVLVLDEGANTWTFQHANPNTPGAGFPHPLVLEREVASVNEDQTAIEFELRQTFRPEGLVPFRVEPVEDDTLRFSTIPGSSNLPFSYMEAMTGKAVPYGDCFDEPYDPDNFTPESQQ